jgi:predicted transcriptional regulator
MALAGAYARSGLTVDMFIDDMLNPVNAGGAKPQEIRDTKGDASAYKWLRDTWETAEGNALTELDPKHVENSLKKFMSHVEAWHWKGRTGSTDRDVLRSITRIGIRHNTLEPLASLRDLRLEAGKALETTKKSVDRLKADRWILQGSPRGGASARVYKLNLEKCAESSTHSIHGGTVNKCVLVDAHILKHPVFTSRKALQGRPAEIWSRLPREWMSVAQAARHTGYSTGTARNVLKRLVSSGLAEVDQGAGPKGGDLYRCKDVDTEHLDMLAKKTGAFEDLESIRQQVEQEREAWNRFLSG